MPETLEKPQSQTTPLPEAAEPAPAKQGFPKSVLLVPLAIVLLGAYFYIHGQGFVSTDDAFIEGHVIQVSARVSGHIQKVYVDDNQIVKAGELLLELDPADYQVKLDQANAALGIVEAKLEAARNSVTITSGTTRADVEQASSGVDLARSALETARAQVASAHSAQRQAEAELAAAESEVSQEQANATAAEAEENQAKADLTRYQNLIKDDVVSRQQLDLMITAERTARARLESARQKAASNVARVTAARAAVQAANEGLKQAQTQVAQAQARIGVASGQLDAAQTAPHQVAVSQSQHKALAAERDQAKAAVAQAQLNLNYTKVFAPEAGRVTHKAAETGSFVQAGQSFLALVPQNVWVVANFKETQLTHMRMQQPVEIQVDAYPGMKLKGHVDSIQAGTGARFSLLPPENATGNYVKVVQRVPVKIMLDALPGGGMVLAPGMSVVPDVRVR